jgi:hypothetical protein
MIRGIVNHQERKSQMEAPHVYIVHYQGRDVECYGTLADDSNFSVVCVDECDDDIWCYSIDGDMTWEAVVAELQPHFDSDILEISAV